MYRPDKLIEIIKIADTRKRWHLKRDKDFCSTRDYFIKKLMEEMGEYAEAIVFEEGTSNRKLRKFGVLDKNDVVNHKKWKELSDEKLREEIVDILYVALVLARLEKVSAEEIVERISAKKDMQ